MNPLRAIIYPDFMAGGFRLVIFDPATAQEPNMEVVPVFTTVLAKQSAERLAESLDAAGIETERRQKDREQTPAMRRHLEDMRAIAFAKLNVEAPKGTP